MPGPQRRGAGAPNTGSAGNDRDNRRGGGRDRDNRGGRDSGEKNQYVERVVTINRVVKVVKVGLSFKIGRANDRVNE